MRECNLDEFNANGCRTQDIVLDAGENKNIDSPSGQNMVCSCLEDLCNKSPWYVNTIPTTRRPSSPAISEDDSRADREGLHQTNQHDVTWYSPETHTDSKGVPLPTDPEGVLLPTDSEEFPLPTDSEGGPLPADSEGVPLPTDSEGVSLPDDSDGVPLIEKSMSTQSMDHTLPAGYNDHSTDKIPSNGVKALNDDMVFATLLTLLNFIF